jgi:hypothetical protein
MAAILVTETTSRSRARAQAVSTGVGPHFRPGQVVIEQAFGVDADIRAVTRRGSDQPVQIRIA